MVEQGGTEPFSLVLLNEASAYPHGTEKPQSVREGSTILIDTGCKYHGYASDISRTWVYGKPSARQREVWDTVKRGQEIALETAKVGQPVGDIDIAVRNFYEGKGWAQELRPARHVPPHRTRHRHGRPRAAEPHARRPHAARRPACASPTSPGSTFPASSGSAWRTAGS